MHANRPCRARVRDFVRDWHLALVLDTGDFVFLSGITGARPDFGACRPKVSAVSGERHAQNQEPTARRVNPFSRDVL
jgi:hypothetical protein